MSYFKKRGLTQETIDKYKLREENGKAIIPYLDLDGSEVSYNARSLDGQEPKYKYQAGKPRYLYNFQMLLSDKENEWNKDLLSTLFICEGEIDTLTMLQAGYPAVGTNAQMLKLDWVQLFIDRRMDTIHLSDDGDDQGLEGAIKKAQLIYDAYTQTQRYVNIWIWRLPKGKDLNDIYLESPTNFPSRILELIENADPFPLKQEGNLTTSVTDFINSELPEREDLIGGGLLPKASIAVVGGQSKLGKSLFVTQMGIRLATGSNFLSKFPCKKSRVLLIQQEISEFSMQKRLRKQLSKFNPEDLEGNFHLVNTKGIKLDRRDGLKKVRETIREVRPDVLIMDPLYKFHFKEENSASDMRNVFDRVDELVSEFGLSVVIVHHHGKPSEFKRKGAHQLRGSSVIFDYGDSYFVLNRKGGNESRSFIKLSFELRNAEEPPPMFLHRDPETLWYEVTSEDLAAKVSELDVVEAFQELEDKGVVEKRKLVNLVENKTEASSKTVERRLKDMDGGFFESFRGEGRGNPIFYRKKV